MAAGQGAMTAVAQYGIAHSQLFKQASILSPLASSAQATSWVQMAHLR